MCPSEELTDEHADQLLTAGASAQVDHMLTYTAAGTPPEVGDYLDEFLRLTGADELITVHQATTIEGSAAVGRAAGGGRRARHGVRSGCTGLPA